MFIVYTELLLIYSTSEFIFYYLLYICYSLVLMSYFVFFNPEDPTVNHFA